MLAGSRTDLPCILCQFGDMLFYITAYGDGLNKWNLVTRLNHITMVLKKTVNGRIIPFIGLD